MDQGGRLIRKASTDVHGTRCGDASPARPTSSRQRERPLQSAAGRQELRLRWAFGLVLGFLAVEVATGLLTNSLALLSDAGHMSADVVALGMSLGAIQLARRGPEIPHRTFGLYRLEILAALANAVVLFGAAFYVLYEALRRLAEPPEILALPMLAAAILGLGVNLVVFRLLRPGARESLTIEGAYVEVVADTLGSVGAITAAVVLETAGWAYIDPLVAAGIGVFILPRAWRLGSRSLRILVQVAPPHIDAQMLEADLAALPGVVDVHDVHLWTLTSDMEVASAHVMVAGNSDAHAVLDRARRLLQDRYEVTHATLQVEPEDHEGCEQVTW